MHLGRREREKLKREGVRNGTEGIGEGIQNEKKCSQGTV